MPEEISTRFQGGGISMRFQKISSRDSRGNLHQILVGSNLQEIPGSISTWFQFQGGSLQKIPGGISPRFQGNLLKILGKSPRAFRGNLNVIPGRIFTGFQGESPNNSTRYQSKVWSHFSKTWKSDLVIYSPILQRILKNSKLLFKNSEIWWFFGSLL